MVNGIAEVSRGLPTPAAQPSVSTSHGRAGTELVCEGLKEAQQLGRRLDLLIAYCMLRPIEENAHP